MHLTSQLPALAIGQIQPSKTSWATDTSVQDTEGRVAMMREEPRALWGKSAAPVGQTASGQWPREMGIAASPWTAGESLDMCQVPARFPSLRRVA